MVARCTGREYSARRARSRYLKLSYLVILLCHLVAHSAFSKTDFSLDNEIPRMCELKSSSKILDAKSVIYQIY